ncbi:protein-glutamate methylesterase/protein-glutamine glutaminase [Helicovermis profundi]|uniref:Protein-glutamate methylesterase/protein-glutamine glutaminase n=1 Tax=Helicovermis profundi TaxID=3065157 RepID=A0AAU9E3Z2_9FIRM|nr:chemotaxis response regulator protein-glutamate methylesterase [Clostridia bacterium S502]
MKKKVLVVDDSAFMRKVISDLVNSFDKFEVITTAKNGKDAIDKIKNLLPDIVTMDVEMPEMDGITALKIIMKENPLPIIMLSSITKKGADATIKSLELGAIDFITKPSSIFKVNTEDTKKELLEKLEVASKIKYTKNSIYNKPIYKEKLQNLSSFARGSKNIEKIIAIGTSTGGPRALQSVVPNIPGDINASVLIVQHMPKGFTKSLADRLNSMSELEVKEAEDGDVLETGKAYLAPGDKHLRLKKSRSGFVISLEQTELVSGHRPSVDAMMNSIAELKIDNVIGVIMTGMGSDGAKGLEKVKKEKGFIIAQDEDSCVVFGMPKSTIERKVVDVVVPLDRIAKEIINAMEV